MASYALIIINGYAENIGQLSEDNHTKGPSLCYSVNFWSVLLGFGQVDQNQGSALLADALHWLKRSCDMSWSVEFQEFEELLTRQLS